MGFLLASGGVAMGRVCNNGATPSSFEKTWFRRGCFKKKGVNKNHKMSYNRILVGFKINSIAAESGLSVKEK